MQWFNSVATKDVQILIFRVLKDSILVIFWCNITCTLFVGKLCWHDPRNHLPSKVKHRFSFSKFKPQQKVFKDCETLSRSSLRFSATAETTLASSASAIQLYVLNKHVDVPPSNGLLHAQGVEPLVARQQPRRPKAPSSTETIVSKQQLIILPKQMTTHAIWNYD